MQHISLIIDGHDTSVPAGTTLLDAARQLGIDIPTLCHLQGHKTRAVCRICVVALKGSGRMVPACATAATEGMQIETGSAEVLAARRLLMEFTLAEHGECDDATCAIEELAGQLGVSKTRFQAPRHSNRSDLSQSVRLGNPLVRHLLLLQRRVLRRVGHGTDRGHRGPEGL